MKYCSTRGGVKDATFEEALFTGYAKDGGIMLPQEIPEVSADTLKRVTRIWVLYLETPCFLFLLWQMIRCDTCTP